MTTPRSQSPTQLASPPEQDLLSRLSSWCVSGPLTILAVLYSLVLLALWIPHYLTWPWWPDLEVFAYLALAWDSGLAPYRDVHSFNFPGQIYIFWVLGKVFGWGRTLPIYAVDVTMVLALGVLMTCWSRRVFRAFLPGLLGYASFVYYYLGLGLSQVAQRDWHMAFLAVCGLLMMQIWPGRRGRICSALSLALGAALRPYVILFLPAIILEVVSDPYPDPSSGPPARRQTRALAEWGIALGGFTVLAYSPLILQGLFNDFVRCLALVMPGGGYSYRPSANRLSHLILEFQTTTAIVPLAIVLFLSRADQATTRSATTWLVAMGTTLIYEPAAPLVHDYLLVPLHLVLAVNIAVLAHLILTAAALRPEHRLGVLLLLMTPFLAKPLYCNLHATAERLPGLASGEWPSTMPEIFTSPSDTRYQPHYSELTDYLRRSTDKSMRIADLHLGIEPVNAVVGRLSPFPVDAPSLVWFRLCANKPVPLATEREYISCLERTPNSLVVWEPSEPLKGHVYPNAGEGPFDFSELAATIRKLYEPEARFGPIEVWRRKGEAAP